MSGLLFALKHWKLVVGGIGLLVIITVVTLHFREFNARAARIAVLEADKVTLELVIDTQKEVITAQADAIESWSDAMDNVQETMQEMADNQVEANEQSRRLNDVLGKHDLEALSLARPELVERTINRASADVFRMLHDKTAGNIHEDD